MQLSAIRELIYCNQTNVGKQNSIYSAIGGILGLGQIDLEEQLNKCRSRRITFI